MDGDYYKFYFVSNESGLISKHCYDLQYYEDSEIWRPTLFDRLKFQRSQRVSAHQCSKINDATTVMAEKVAVFR